MGATPLTREERSKMRVLAAYGISGIDISRMLDRSSQSVYKILSGRAGSSDEGDDYDFVDAEFAAQYPPLMTSTNRSQLPSMRNKERTEARSVASASTSRSTTGSVAYPPLKLEDSKEHKGQRDGTKKENLLATIAVTKTETTSGSAHTKAPSGSTSRTPRKGPYTRRSLSPGVRDNSDLGDMCAYYHQQKQTRPYALRAAGSSRHRAIPIEIESSPEPELDEIQPPLPDLHQFLANLEHDLSDIMDALTEQDLGTHEKLFALASWPEDELHSLFKEALPELTVAQRFMLVKGMKKSAGV
ncbi:hypothetical protein FPV67DRAFT_440340 [Lyophyllum atratum]|nr:hypothetical protein FPV67DRAFT_440340 [Lyophyllum atratum]